MKTFLLISMGLFQIIEGMAQHYRASFTGDNHVSHYGSSPTRTQQSYTYSRPHTSYTHTSPTYTRTSPTYSHTTPTYYDPRTDPRFKQTYRPYRPTYVRYSDRFYYPQYRLYGSYVPYYYRNYRYASVYSGYYPYVYSAGWKYGYYPRLGSSTQRSVSSFCSSQPLLLAKSGNLIKVYACADSSSLHTENQYTSIVRINDPNIPNAELVNGVANLLSGNANLRNEYLVDRHNFYTRKILKYVRKFNRGQSQ